LIRKRRSPAASGRSSAAIAQTMTPAMLATSSRLAIAKADACCQASSGCPADLSNLKQLSIGQR
jgi:hypothetical protein